MQELERAQTSSQRHDSSMHRMMPHMIMSADAPRADTSTREVKRSPAGDALLVEHHRREGREREQRDDGGEGDAAQARGALHILLVDHLAGDLAPH